VAILELGHTGLYVNDLAVMRDFCERGLALTVTDEDSAQGTIFLSSARSRNTTSWCSPRGALHRWTRSWSTRSPGGWTACIPVQRYFTVLTVRVC